MYCHNHFHNLRIASCVSNGSSPEFLQYHKSVYSVKTRKVQKNVVLLISFTKKIKIYLYMSLKGGGDKKANNNITNPEQFS